MQHRCRSHLAGVSPAGTRPSRGRRLGACVGLVVTALSAPAFAQGTSDSESGYLHAHAPEPNHWEFGAFGGLLFLSPGHDLRDADGSRDPHFGFSAPSFELGARFGYYPLPYFGVEGEFMQGQARVDAPSTEVVRRAAMVASYDAGLVFQLPYWSIVPFASLGGGAMSVVSNPMGKDTDPFGFVGIGGRFALNDLVAIRLDLRARAHERNSDRSGGMAFSQEGLLGVALTFGKGGEAAPPPALPPDRDRDHVPDATDACPDTGYLNTPDGCPPDSDADGVRDPDDHCPREAGLVEFDGCPDSDPDKDGVRIPLDRCPDEPGVPPEGCPVRDEDGDGILDGVDRCPLEAETKNGVDDEDGCPEVPSSPADLKGLEGAIEGIRFEANQAELIPANPEPLQRIAEVLKQYPNLRVEISGHTDKLGLAHLNQELSQRRAESVKLWLVDRGIPADRIRAVGRGSSEPRASNNTADGRAANRRIELRVLKD